MLLLPKFQSGFRKLRSTETELLKVQSNIVMATDNHEIALLVVLDLSVAFDTIDHQILLTVPENYFGITASILDLFPSKLSDQKQRVLINDQSSCDFHLNCIVSQGSFLDPVLFTLYVSRLYHVIAHRLPSVHEYANDTQLYLSFRPDSHGFLPIPCLGHC